MKLKNNIVCICLFISLYGFSQPTQVLDINNGNNGSIPFGLFSHNGFIYFSADDSGGSNTPGGLDLGRELWISDGTSVNTTFVKDLNNGNSNSTPNNFFTQNGSLYFSANSGSGDVLFTSNGTETGTMSTAVGLVDIPVTLGNLTYNINDSDKKLYVFNGTSNVPVPGSGEEYIQNEQIIAFNNKLFLYLNTTSEIGTVGTELYAYEAGVFQLIKDVAGNQLDSELSNFTVSGTTLYFSAFSASELWKSNGTEIGTEQVTVASGISGFNNYFGWDGKLFFEGDDGSSDQLWVYDPTEDSVTNLSNLSGTAPNHDPSDYAELNGWLYYRGEDSSDNNGHLWRTDGTTTFQLDETIINVDDIVALNNKLFFEGNNGTDGNELFEFDPATLSIKEVNNKNIIVYPNPSQGKITISRKFQDVLNYELFDINGRTIKNGILENNTIQFQLKSGLYLINLKNSEINITKKLMVD